jgi:hypothetical protein
MEKDPEFLILKPTVGWLPEKEWKKILGAAVKNHWSPTNDSVPENPLVHNKHDLVEAKFEDFVLRKEAVTSSSFELEVKNLGKLKWAKGVGKQLDLQGKVIHVKRLRQHDQFWKSLSSKDEESMQTVADWVKEKRRGRAKNQVCLVVGLLICEDVVVAESDEEVRELEARGVEPLGTIIEYAAASQGVPVSTSGTGNVTAQASRTSVSRTYFKAAGIEKSIFALELRIITSKKGESKLTDNTPKASSNRKLGEDDVEPEDVLLRDIGPENWEQLLQEVSGERKKESETSKESIQGSS